MAVQTNEGAFAITVPDVPPGHGIVVDMGTDLRTWEHGDAGAVAAAAARSLASRAGSPSSSSAASLTRCRRTPRTTPPTRATTPPTSHSRTTTSRSRTAARRAARTTRAPTAPRTLSSLAATAGGGAVPEADETQVNASTYPGYDEGFERGVDEQGKEIYRYVANNQVYVIPGDQYYAWRSQYYHGSLTHEILQVLLIGRLPPDGLSARRVLRLAPLLWPIDHAILRLHRLPRALRRTDGRRWPHDLHGRQRRGRRWPASLPLAVRACPRQGRPVSGASSPRTPVAQGRPVASPARTSYGSSYGSRQSYGGSYGSRPYTPVAHARPVTGGYGGGYHSSSGGYHSSSSGGRRGRG